VLNDDLDVQMSDGIGCSTLVDRQQRTHGHRWLNGELKARQDQQMTLSAGDDKQYWRQALPALSNIAVPLQ